MRSFHWIVTIVPGFLLTACSGVEDQLTQEAVAVTTAVPAVVTADKYPGPAKQPNYGPAYGSISFVDTDPGETIGGVLRMGRAVDEQGNRLDESEEGISMYMVHWGLVVGQPGVEDDRGAGDLGGDCRGFRDTGHIVMSHTSELDADQPLEWVLPAGTVVPEGALYFVGHTVYGKIHNLAKCTQLPIANLVE